MKIKYTIYTLEDIKGNIFYVGKTKNIGSRYASHSSFVNTAKDYSRYKSAIENGKECIIQSIDECDDNNEALELEQYWIAQLTAWGFSLTNKKQGRKKLPESEKRVLVAAYLTKKVQRKIRKKYGNLTNAVRTVIIPYLLELEKNGELDSLPFNS